MLPCPEARPSVFTLRSLGKQLKRRKGATPPSTQKEEERDAGKETRNRRRHAHVYRYSVPEVDQVHAARAPGHVQPTKQAGKKKKKEENPTGSSGLRATTPCKNTLSPAEDLKMYATFAAAVAAHM